MCVSVENINQPYFCNVSHASNANILCSRGNLNILVLTSFHVQGHVRPLQTAAPWARAEGLSKLNSFFIGIQFSICLCELGMYCCIILFLVQGCLKVTYSTVTMLANLKKTGHFLTTNRIADWRRDGKISEISQDSDTSGKRRSVIPDIQTWLTYSRSVNVSLKYNVLCNKQQKYN